MVIGADNPDSSKNAKESKYSGRDTRLHSLHTFKEIKASRISFSSAIEDTLNT
jgi:hypothetical protein